MSGIPLRSLLLKAARACVAGLLVVAATAVLGGVGLGDATGVATGASVAASTPVASGLASTVTMSEGLPHEAAVFHGDAAFSSVEEDETDPEAFGLGTRTRAAGHPTVWLPQRAPRHRVACGHRRYHLRI